jgi:hypothetical protein
VYPSPSHFYLIYISKEKIGGSLTLAFAIEMSFTMVLATLGGRMATSAGHNATLRTIISLFLHH